VIVYGRVIGDMDEQTSSHAHADLDASPRFSAGSSLQYPFHPIQHLITSQVQVLCGHEASLYQGGNGVSREESRV
jgi:hypothetical protein